MTVIKMVNERLYTIAHRVELPFTENFIRFGISKIFASLLRMTAETLDKRREMHGPDRMLDSLVFIFSDYPE